MNKYIFSINILPEFGEVYTIGDWLDLSVSGKIIRANVIEVEDSKVTFEAVDEYNILEEFFKDRKVSFSMGSSQ